MSASTSTTTATTISARGKALTTTTTTTELESTNTPPPALTSIDNGCLALILTIDFPTAQYAEDYVITAKPWDAIKNHLGCVSTAMRASPTQIQYLEVFPSSDAALKFWDMVGTDAVFLEKLSSGMTIKGSCFGDVTANVRKGVAGWDSMPSVDFKALDFNGSLRAKKEYTFGYVYHAVYKSEEAMANAIELSETWLADIMNFTTMSATVVTGPTTCDAVGMFENEKDWVTFNTLLSSPKYAAMMGELIPTMVSNDLYAFGLNDPAAQGSLAAWNAVPGFNCAGYPSSMGYGSDGPMVFVNQVFYKSESAMAEGMALRDLFNAASQESGVAMQITFKTGPTSCIQASVNPSNGSWANLLGKMGPDTELGAAMPKMLDGMAANLVNVMGSTTKATDQGFQMWWDMPMIHNIPGTTAFCHVGDCTKTGMVCVLFSVLKTAEALEDAIGVHYHPEVMGAIRDSGSTVVLHINSPTSYTAFYNSPTEEAFLQFNEAQKPHWTPERIDNIAKLDGYYAGNKSGPVAEGMSAWDQVPHFTMKRTETMSGFPSV